MIPFDQEFVEIEAEEFCSRILIETLGRRAGLGGRELPLRRARRRATPRCSARATGVRDPGRAAGRGRRRDRLLDPDPGAGRGRRRRGRDALPRRAVPARGRGRRGRQARAHARLPDRERRPRRRARRSRATASTRRSPTGIPAAVNVGVRPTFETGRGLLVEAYLIDYDGRPLRPDAAGRVHRAPARREALRRRRGADRADAPRRRARRASSALASQPPSLTCALDA